MSYPIYFAYNDEGIRTEKVQNGYNHEYILDGSQIVGEWINNKTLLILYIYDETGSPIGMKMRTASQTKGVFDEYFFEKNLQGDIVAVYNSEGEKIGTYTYDAWGNFTVTLASTNTAAENEIVNTYNPFRYRGYYYDVETGLYYLQSRYYNPAWGRFINADAYISTGQGLLGNNMFAYCNNNPIMFVDPNGRSLIGGILLAIVGIGLLGLTGSEPINDNASYATDEPIDPNKPPNPESGYQPPKKNPNPEKVKNPNGAGKGWPDNEGGVWVPDNKQHGGPGWTQQFPDGSHKHRYPDGHVRSHFSGESNSNAVYGRILIVASTIAIIWVVGNDISGVGAVDDATLPALFGTFAKGVEMVAG